MAKHYAEIDEVIKYIHENLDKQLSLSNLAGHVAYSPYHFTRVFKEQTGLTPLYYISSLRLQKAKDLLLTTNFTVRDIGLEVGQQSLGTFTTRFSEKVGMTPSQFRKSSCETKEHLRKLEKLQNWNSLHANKFNTLTGTIESEHPFNGFILVGLFHKPIPEGLPLYGTLLPSTGDFSFTEVKRGTYYLMATAVTWEMQVTDILVPHATLRARSKAPIIIETRSIAPHQNLTLHKPRLDDPPILISLQVLMHNFLIRQKSNR